MILGRTLRVNCEKTQPEDRRQKTEGKRQKGEGRREKGEGKRESNSTDWVLGIED
jgi:hypothetical protein